MISKQSFSPRDVKWKIILGIALLFFFFATDASAASNNGFVSIVNPVRGGEYWTLTDQNPTTNITNSYKIIGEKQLPATWLLRFDALNDQAIVSVVKSFNAQQETGLFLEITGSLAKRAGVRYRQSAVWHEAGSVFLTGYTQEERVKLIDTAVSRYNQVFSSNPKSVGAWWIDAYSLAYLKEKYGITNAMIVADQYSTDKYQIWGQYWSSPYYPSTQNTLMPSQGDERKLDVVVTQWATRDPFNAYGNGVFDSTYSVQANDYIPYHNLDVAYFERLVDVYVNPPANQIGHAIVGLENDFSWKKFGQEYQRQLELLARKASQGELTLVTLGDFATRFRTQNGPTNKITMISTKNPLGGTEHVVWYMSPYYRVGWFYTDKGSVIRNMRLYFDHKEEICLKIPCKEINFAFSDTKALDEVTFGDSWIIDEGEIKDINVQKIGDRAVITYTNKIGNTREIAFTPHDVSVDGKAQSASEAIIKAIDANQATKAQKIAPTSESFEKPWGRLFGGAAIFVLFTLGVLYLPGRLIRKFFSTNEGPFIFAVDCAIGIGLFTLLSYLLGLVDLRVGVLLIHVALALLSLLFEGGTTENYPGRTIRRLWWVVPCPSGRRVAPLRFARTIFAPSRLHVTSHLLTVLLILGGTLLLSLAVIKSGWPASFGIGFWGPNGHDAVWHLSLIEALKVAVPPENFTYAGTTLTNYHYFFDLFVAQIANITKINTLDLLFRFVPILLALLYGFLTYLVAFRISRSTLAANLAIFFAYVGGGFGWIVTYFRGQGFGGESMFWSIQSMSFLLNPPFIISVVLLLAGAVLLFEWFERRDFRSVVPLVILLGFIAEYKAYAVVILLFGLSMAVLYDLVRLRNIKTLLLTGLLTITNIGILLANTKSVEGLLLFSPLWTIHSMVDSRDRLFWERLTLARESGSMVKLVLAEAVGIALFIVGNLGTRILGVWQYVRFKTTFRSNGLFPLLLTGAEIGILLPLLFIQKGTSWNTVQFFYYTLILFNIFAAMTLAQLYPPPTLPLRKGEELGVATPPRVLRGRLGRGMVGVLRPLVCLVIIGVVVLLTLPTTNALLQTYLPNRAPARLSYGELKALDFLRSQPPGTVLTYPFYEKVNLKFEEPVPLFSYTTTAYVSAFSGKPAYFEDRMNNEIIGQDIKERLVGQQEIFKNTNPEFTMKFLRDNNISYIYLPRFLKTHIDEGAYGVKNIYHTDDVNIYKVL